jgi:transmembrane sensor
MKGVEPAARHDRPDSQPLTATLDWAEQAGATRQVLAELGRRRRVRAVRRGAVGALVAVACGAFFLSRPAAPIPLPPAAVVALAPLAVPPSPVETTPAPEGRTLVLADGSIVELQARAEVEVDFSGALRRVRLKRGMAYFDVAKDPARPFVVTAEGLEVRAVGTAFAVQLAAQKVEVLVTEGRVRVDRPLEADGSAHHALQPVALMEAGEALVVDLKSELGPLPEILPLGVTALQARLDWRAPTVEFSATPLSEVVAVVNRHARQPLVLAEPELGRLRISGFMRADNTTALLRLIELELGLVTEPRADGATLLRARP